MSIIAAWTSIYGNRLKPEVCGACVRHFQLAKRTNVIIFSAIIFNVIDSLECLRRSLELENEHFV